MLGSGSYKSSLTYYRLVALAKQLAHKGHCVSIIAPSADKYNNFTPDKQASLESIHLIQPWQLTTKNALANLIPYLFTSTSSIVKNRADVVFIYKPTPITIMGILPRLLFRTPVILDLDDLGSEVMRLQGQSKLQVSLVAACEKIAMRFASGVVVASSYLESIVKEKHPNKPVLILSNGIDTSEFKPLPVQKPRHAVYYFGALNRLSLIEELLQSIPETVQAVPDTHFYIIGGGTALNAAKALVHQLGMTKHVTFTGWVDMLDVYKYAQFGDVAVCCQPDTPTVRAASNLKVFQYMAMGSATVVSDVGDLRRYIGNTEAGVAVPAGQIATLVSATVSLLLDEGRRTRIAKAGIARAHNEYALSVLGDKLLKFTESITDKKARNSREVTV